VKENDKVKPATYVIMFACGNRPTPSGEVFVMARPGGEAQDKALDIKKIFADNGLPETYFELPYADCDCKSRMKPAPALNLADYSKYFGKAGNYMSLFLGKWLVLSSESFMKGWKCWKGDFTQTPKDTLKIDMNWEFQVPVIGKVTILDQFTFDTEATHGVKGSKMEPVFDAFQLENQRMDGVKMPEILKKLMAEKRRPLRLLGVSPKKSQVASGEKDLDWVVMFACGNTPTPQGERFILIRPYALAKKTELMPTFKKILKDNGIDDRFDEMPQTDCDNDKKK